MKQVRIYSPTRNVMQSGKAKTGGWVVEYELPTPRRPDALMGWVSSSDTLNQVRLKFDGLEKAIAFVQEKGWGYSVLPAHERKVKPRNYADNFRYMPPKDKVV
jgi:hypothetical protein